jgi:hypothetical protein
LPDVSACSLPSLVNAITSMKSPLAAVFDLAPPLLRRLLALAGRHLAPLIKRRPAAAAKVLEAARIMRNDANFTCRRRRRRAHVKNTALGHTLNGPEIRAIRFDSGRGLHQEPLKSQQKSTNGRSPTGLFHVPIVVRNFPLISMITKQCQKLHTAKTQHGTVRLCPGFRHKSASAVFGRWNGCPKPDRRTSGLPRGSGRPIWRSRPIA